MFRRMRVEDLRSLAPRRICLIKPSALGDVVQTLPLLPVLKRAYPQASISWVINRGFSELLNDHPLIDEVLPFDRRGGLTALWTLLRELRRRRFDLVFDLQGLLRSGLMTRATGARTRVGLEAAREGSWLAYHLRIPNTRHGQPAHALYWRLAECLGLGKTPRAAALRLDDSTRAWSVERLGSLGRPVLTVAPGAQWITKRWLPEKFAETATRAARHFGWGVCLVGSDAERLLADSVAEMIRARDPQIPVLNLSGETNLKQLAAVLADSRILLGNDSGPMHLAAAMGTPVVGIFLCTSAIRSGPAGAGHELVSTRVACAARYKKQCPHKGADCLACLRDVDVASVYDALARCERRLCQGGDMSELSAA